MFSREESGAAMAKYTIIHSCGCTEEVQIFGTNVHGERDHRTAWLESQPCKECYARERNAGGNGLAVLDGTPKQVAWAVDIRSDMLADVERFEAEATRRVTPGMEESVDEMLGAIRSEVERQASAKWFIDNRLSFSARARFAELARDRVA